MKSIIKIELWLTTGQIIHNNVDRVTCLVFWLVFVAGIMVNSPAAKTQTVDSSHATNSWMICIGNGYSHAGPGPQSKAGGGLTFRTALYCQVDHIVFSARVTYNTGGKSNYDDYLLSDENSDELLLDFLHEKFYDLGLLIGGATRQDNGLRLIALTGITIVCGKRIIIKEYEPLLSWLFFPEIREYFVDRQYFNPCIGIPFELGLTYNVNRFLGVGLITYANLNPEESFCGVTLNVIMELNKRDKYRKK
jgi:hypothetical protein